MKNALLFLLFLISWIGRSQSLNLTVDMNTVNAPGSLQGFCTSGMFDLVTYNPAYGLNPLTANFSYQQLLKLDPKVLRFPTGGKSKYTRLLGADPDDFTTIRPYCTGGHCGTYGYGYNLALIVTYLSAYYGVPETAFEDIDCDATDLEDYELEFCDWQLKVHDQGLNKFEPAIIQFKRMVYQLETDLGHQIDIIYTMNIHTADPEYNRRVIDYLIGETDIDGDGTRDAGTGVHVAGVELGNEENYGDEYASFTDYKNDVWDDINMIRTEWGNTVKIGIVAAPPGDLQRVEYITSPCTYQDAYSNSLGFNAWNSSLFTATNSITVGSSTYKAWDAAIIHPYIDYDIFKNSCDACDLFTSSSSITAVPPTSAMNKLKTDINNFFDPPVGCDALDPPATYIGYHGLMQYYIDKIGSNDLKLWVTEWNFHPEDYGAMDGCIQDKHIQCGANTLLQGTLIQRWMMEMYKTNADNAGIIQYATIHNYLGTNSETNLISRDAVFDASYQGYDILETGPIETTSHVNENRRIDFYPFQFSSLLKNARIAPLSGDVAVTDLHLHAYTLPYGITKFKKYIYIYFENASSSSKTIDFNSNVSLICSDGDCIFVTYAFSGLTADCISANTLYSTAGNSQLYKYSTYYWDEVLGECEEVATPAFNINDVTHPSITSGVVTIPKFSFGYIKVLATLYPPKLADELESGTVEISVSPNPSGSSFQFQINTTVPNSVYKIQILDLMGKQVDEISSNTNDVNYSCKLSSGTYIYKVLNTNNQVIGTGKLIKID